MGLTAGGIKGITLEKGDKVADAVVLNPKNQYIFSVTSLGFGKKSDLKEYSVIKRGGKGIVNYKVNDRTGNVVSTAVAKDREQYILITKKSKVKRIKVKDVKKMGRASQGSAISIIAKGDHVIEMAPAPVIKVNKK
jgi:DNA gyrase subunit A